jgi:hypothetical protein
VDPSDQQLPRVGVLAGSGQQPPQATRRPGTAARAPKHPAGAL